MKIKEICTFLEEIAPLSYQENYDNAGLITGNFNTEITGILISLDCTEIILEEAISLGYNMVITHHPIVFKGLKKITGANYVERTIIKAIKNEIAIYAIHTNLDHVLNGVNGKIAQKLNLINVKVLRPKIDTLCKLVTYCPVSYADKIRQTLFEGGAGNLGNYTEASFNSNGIGTFKGNNISHAFVGEKNQQHHEEETKIEVIFEQHKQKYIVSKLIENHPYEEVAYNIVALKNQNQNVGAGAIGQLSSEMDVTSFLEYLKEKMNISVIRHSALLDKMIKTVAICGGAGSFLLEDAKRLNADIFISGDFKYHEFFDADDKIVIADIGHYESEQFTQELLLDVITNKFSNFAIRLTENNTNPIKYLA